MDKKSSRYGLIVLLTIAVIAILMGFSKIASAKRVPEGFSQKTFDEFEKYSSQQNQNRVLEIATIRRWMILSCLGREANLPNAISL